MKGTDLKREDPVARTNRQGFTLVEFLISFVLTSLLITGIAQLAIHALLIKRSADLNLTSSELVSSKLEDLKSLSFESDEMKEGQYKETLTTENTHEPWVREWRIQDISPSLKRIEIHCFSQNRPFKKIRLILLLSRELGF